MKETFFILDVEIKSVYTCSVVMFAWVTDVACLGSSHRTPGHGTDEAVRMTSLRGQKGLSP